MMGPSSSPGPQIAAAPAGPAQAFPPFPREATLYLRVLGTGIATIALGLLAGAVPPLYTAVAIAALALLVLSFRRPIRALYALLLAVPLSSVAGVDLPDVSINATEPVAAILLIAWTARGFARRSLALSPSPALVPMAAVLAAMLASTVNSISLAASVKEVVKWLELVLAYLFLTSLATTWTELRRVVLALLLIGSGEAVVGIFQFLASYGPSHFSIGPFLRAYGTFGQPNPFAGYLGTILLPAALLAIQRDDSRLRWAGLVAAALISLALVASFSRGAWLGAIMAAGAAMIVWSPRSRRLLAPAAGAFLVVAVLAALNLLPPDVNQRLGTALGYFGVFDVRTVELTPENWSVVQRMAYWQAAWNMFVDHPWLGVGTGNYALAYDTYSVPGWPDSLGHAHNYYLNTLAETGIIGLLALVLTFLLAFVQVLRPLLRTSVRGSTRALLAGVLAALVFLVVHSLFDNRLLHGMSLQVGVLLGLAVAVARETSAPSDQTPARNS